MNDKVKSNVTLLGEKSACAPEFADQTEFTMHMQGKEVYCSRWAAVKYRNGLFSTGIAKGIEPDTVYLRVDRDGCDPVVMYSRPDELLAVISVCAQVLWELQVPRDGIGSLEKFLEEACSARDT